MNKKRLVAAVASLVCAALFAIPVFAGQKPATESHKTTAPITKAALSAWPAESLTGRITMVDAARRIVIIRNSSRVPFDIVVDHSTHIKSGQRELKLEDLTSDVNKNASVKFAPERRGDIARSIQLNR